MTAINLVRKRYSAAILSDAAGYDADGIVRCFYTKCAAIPHLRAAIGARGCGAVASLFVGAIGATFNSFDDMVASGHEIERLYDTNLYALSDSGESEIELLLAGWSESRDRPETYVLSSRADHPFEWIKAEAIHGGPIPEEQHLRAAGLNPETDTGSFDFVHDGVKLLQAQRLGRYPTTTHNPSGPRLHLVGGHILLTEITRAGVSQRVIYRYPDVLGQRITPEPAQQRSSFPNRKQRSAANAA